MIKPIEKALEQVNNRFLLTTVVARRWENIVAGAPPLVEKAPGQSQIDLVFREVIEGKVKPNSETMRIEVEGMPQVEENDEPLFSSALPTEAGPLGEAMGAEGDKE